MIKVWRIAIYTTTLKYLINRNLMIIKLGVEGKDIIKKLIVNSETFEKRTEFSKQKYLKKKKEK